MRVAARAAGHTGRGSRLPPFCLSHPPRWRHGIDHGVSVRARWKKGQAQPKGNPPVVVVVALQPLPGWLRLRLKTWVALATANGQAREWAGDERRRKAEHGGVGTPNSWGASGFVPEVSADKAVRVSGACALSGSSVQ